jgi:hypothetical protein
MATSRTPHMNITIPDDSQPGPAYADNISTGCLYPLGEHTHDGVNTGALINIAGQIIVNDLNLDGYNLTGTRALRTNSQSSVLNGTNDVNEFYVVNGNAYFNNADGYPIALTNGNQAVTLPFNNFTGVNLSNTNLSIPSNANYNMLNVSTSSAIVTITLPLAASVVAGRFFIIQDVGNNISNNLLAVQVAGGSGNLIYYEGVGFSPFDFTANGQSVIFVSDGAANWHTFNFWKNVFVFDTISYGGVTANYTDSAINLYGSELSLDGYSSLLGDGYFNWNSPTQAFVVSAGAVEVIAPDGVFVEANGGITGNWEVVGNLEVGGKITGNGNPINFGVFNVTAGTSMSVNSFNVENGIIYIQNGSLSANSTLTINTGLAGIWFIVVGFVTFNSHHLFITNNVGGVNITSTPVGSPASNFLITAVNTGDSTGMWLSTGTIT